MSGKTSLAVAPVRTGLERAGAVAPFACLYVAFGATFGVIGTGAPLVFRAHGAPLGAVGLMQLISLPIGITFLWAPFIDRWRWPGLPHRLGWIILAQVATVVLLLALSRGALWPLGLLFVLAVGVAVALATMDVALEALVVETVSRAGRPAVTTAKLVGSSIGTTIGIGLVTAWPSTLDLSHAVLIVAALDALLLLPILRYPEVARRQAAAPPRPARPTRARFRAIAAHAGVLGLYFAAALTLSGTPSLALVDLRVPLPIVGLVTGPASTALSICAMLLSGFALSRRPAYRLVPVMALGAGAAGLGLAAAMGGHAAGPAVAAALIHVAFDAALGVPVFNMMYRWSEGDHAAADYALLFGTAFLVSFPVRVASPMLAAALGWPLFFALGVPAYLAAALVLARAMKRTANVPA